MRRPMLWASSLVITAGLTVSLFLHAQDPPPNKPDKGDLRTKAILRDRASAFWIYDDVQAAYATAKKTGKPILVYFR